MLHFSSTSHNLGEGIVVMDTGGLRDGFLSRERGKMADFLATLAGIGVAAFVLTLFI